MSEKAARKQDTKFKPGQSGNPNGKPKGCRNKATRAAQELLDGEAEALTRKCVELALAGNEMALRLCMERILPKRKDVPIELELPKLERLNDVPDAIGGLMRAVGEGRLTPAEAASLSSLLSEFCQALARKEEDSRRDHDWHRRH